MDCFFSIVIPVYNVEKYIEECIKSVLSQTYSDFEIILINDGSTDGSEKICQYYTEKYRNIFLFSESNSGLSHARNYGASLTHGKYLIFLDSDDIWVDSAYLENIHQLFVKNPQLECVASKECNFFDSVKRKYKMSFDYPSFLAQKGVFSGDSFLQTCLKYDIAFPWHPVLYAFSTSFWKSNAFGFPEKRTYEDISLIYRVLLKVNCMCIYDNITYGYRIRNNSISNFPSFKNMENKLLVISENINDVNSRSDIDSSLRALLCDSFAREYFSIVIQSDQTENVDELESLLIKNKWVTKYCQSGMQKYLAILMKVFGFKFVAWVLHLRRRWKYGS